MLPCKSPSPKLSLMSWKVLDKQMSQYAARLVHELRLAETAAERLATTIAADTRFLSQEHKIELSLASPVQLHHRLTELRAFQGWMDYASAVSDPYVARAQVLTQNYVCFVYLPESCFKILSKVCPAGSAARKCSKYLTDNPIRAFRNSIAHANWEYKEDFSGLIFWAKKGSNAEEPLSRFEVNQVDLNYWQALSRCVAYAALSNV